MNSDRAEVWKKFIKYLLVGFSSLVLLFVAQASVLKESPQEVLAIQGCTETPAEYPQCGGTCNGQTFDSSHTVYVVKSVDGDCNVTWSCTDQGAKPGECGNPVQQCTCDSNTASQLCTFQQFHDSCGNLNACSGTKDCSSPPPPPPPPPSACVPNGSCSASTPSCGQTTSGVDNCGNGCTRQGDACPAPAPVVCNSVFASASPSILNPGQFFTLNLSGDASTFVGDNFGGANCTQTSLSGSGGSFSCTAPASAGTFVWTHTWSHCEGSFSNCSSQCSTSAAYTVNQPSACVPNGSCSASTPSCGQTTSGVDNCGNGCTRQGTVCQTPPPAVGGPITVSPVITNTNNNTNTVTVNPPATVVQTFGNVGIARTASAQVAGVKELPKTGLPALAWSALAFIPAGFKIRRFSKVKKDLEDHPSYIFENRKFKTQS